MDALVLFPGYLVLADGYHGYLQDDYFSWLLLPTGQACEWHLASGAVATTVLAYITLLIPALLVLWGISIGLDRGSSIKVKDGE